MVRFVRWIGPDAVSRKTRWICFLMTVAKCHCHVMPIKAAHASAKARLPEWNQGAMRRSSIFVCKNSLSLQFGSCFVQSRELHQISISPVNHFIALLIWKGMAKCPVLGMLLCWLLFGFPVACDFRCKGKSMHAPQQDILQFKCSVEVFFFLDDFYHRIRRHPRRYRQVMFLLLCTGADR